MDWVSTCENVRIACLLVSVKTFVSEILSAEWSFMKLRFCLKTSSLHDFSFRKLFRPTSRTSHEEWRNFIFGRDIFSSLPRNPWKDHVERCFINKIIGYEGEKTFNLFFRIVLHTPWLRNLTVSKMEDFGRFCIFKKGINFYCHTNRHTKLVTWGNCLWRH